MKPSSLRIVAVLVGLASALALGTHSAQGAGQEPAVVVEVKETAILREEGVLRVTLRAKCEPVGDLLEAFVLIQQDEVSGMGGFGPICDGQTRTYRVLVQPIDGVFEPGTAHASAFVLLCDETGAMCEQGQDSRTIRVRGRR